MAWVIFCFSPSLNAQKDSEESFLKKESPSVKNSSKNKPKIYLVEGTNIHGLENFSSDEIVYVTSPILKLQNKQAKIYIVEGTKLIGSFNNSIEITHIPSKNKVKGKHPKGELAKVHSESKKVIPKEKIPDTTLLSISQQSKKNYGKEKQGQINICLPNSFAKNKIITINNEQNYYLRDYYHKREKLIRKELNLLSISPKRSLFTRGPPA